MDMLRSLEDLRETLNRVAMAGQWNTEQKKTWEDQGKAVYQEPLRAVDQVRF